MDRGLRLKDLRESKRLSQTDAARHLGISKQTLYKYENNIITNIPSDVIEKMAALYETSPAYIMGWENDYTIDIKSSLANKAFELWTQYEGLTPEQKIAFENYLKFLQSQS